MKNLVSGLVWLFVVSFSVFGGIQSAFAQSDLYRPLRGIPNATVIGNVQTQFESVSAPLQKQKVNEAAYIALLGAAKKEHSGNIDVADISWVFDSSFFGKNKYTANGKVVSFDGGNQRNTATATAV